MKFILISLAAFLIICQVRAASEDLIYGYECQIGKCIKVELSEKNFDKAISLPVCRMLCAKTIGTIWPQPTGEVNVAPLLLHIDVERINYELPESKDQRLTQLWTDVEERFKAQLKTKIPEARWLKNGGHSLKIKINLTNANKQDSANLPRLTLNTDESYKLNASAIEGDAVTVTITADNFFGARHALETLGQLIVYDDIRREVQMLGKVDITDAPAYKWRGLLLDTSRNFYSVKALKRTLGN